MDTAVGLKRPLLKMDYSTEKPPCNTKTKEKKLKKSKLPRTSNQKLMIEMD